LGTKRKIALFRATLSRTNRKVALIKATAETIMPRVNNSHDSELLGFWTFSIVQYSRS
jgi:hypothetical protein